MAPTVEEAIAALSAIDGEPVPYLLDMLSQVVQVPLTPERKKALQSPKNQRQMTWLDEALDDVALAIELGEL